MTGRRPRRCSGPSALNEQPVFTQTATFADMLREAIESVAGDHFEELEYAAPAD